MRDKYDFYRAGRALLQEDPKFFSLINKKVNQYQEQAIADTSRINLYFYYFCILQAMTPAEVRQLSARSTMQLISTRRLFIALILKIYDPMYLAGYAGRMADKLRQHISDCLNCHEVWVSNIARSVKHELLNLKGYGETVQTLIDKIHTAMSEENIEIPPFNNSRNDEPQLSMF